MVAWPVVAHVIIVMSIIIILQVPFLSERWDQAIDPLEPLTAFTVRFPFCPPWTVAYPSLMCTFRPPVDPRSINATRFLFPLGWDYCARPGFKLPRFSSGSNPPEYYCKLQLRPRPHTTSLGLDMSILDGAAGQSSKSHARSYFLGSQYL